MGNEEVSLLFEDDLDEFLRQIGLYDDFYSGKIKCPICGKTITKKNLGIIATRNGKPFFICDSIQCISKFLGEE